MGILTLCGKLDCNCNENNECEEQKEELDHSLNHIKRDIQKLKEKDLHYIELDIVEIKKDIQHLGEKLDRFDADNQRIFAKLDKIYVLINTNYTHIIEKISQK